VKTTRYLTASGPLAEEIRVPVAEIEGAKDGPTFVIVAGVHACEYTGIEAARRLLAVVDPASMCGRLIVVPCLNLPAFFGLTAHVTPIDGVNAGRVFPGNPLGSYTERMVHLVWDRLARHADYVVDMHGGDLEEELTPFSLVTVTGRASVDGRAEALARAFTLPVLVRRRLLPDAGTGGTGLHMLAASVGIPSVLTEVGSHGRIDAAEVSLLVQGLLNALRHAGMLRGAPAPQRTPMVLNRFTGVYAPAQGLWFPAVHLGEEVRRGQRLGEMRGLFDEPICEIVSEDDAMVLVVVTSPPRRPGDILFGLGMRE
jgi:hypothetical protein